MKKIMSLLLIATLMLGTLTACSNQSASSSITDSQFKFNTIMTITLYGYNDQAIFNEIWAYVDQLEQSFSANIETSDVSRFNETKSLEPISMTADIVHMVDRAYTFSDLTAGKFDLTVEPLVKDWAISTDHPRVPTQEEIDEDLKHINYQNIVVNTEANTLAKLDPEVRLDLGAIAKGYTADQLAAFIQSKGISKAILNLGGNIYALGEKAKDTPWNVGVQNPFEPTGDVLGTIKAVNKSVVTSGSYERFFEKDGKTYHHIIDPDSGYPFENELISVTIVSDLSMDGDILSTSSFALGLQGGINLIDSLENVGAIFVTKDKKIYFAGDRSLVETFELKNDAFTVEE